MRRLLVLVALSGIWFAPMAAQVKAPPVGIIPAFNLTFCPPPAGTFLACTLSTSVTPVSNGTTVETDLFSYAMPANVLSVNGQKLRVTAWGTMAANANTKTIKAYFGGTNRNFTNVTTAGNSVAWQLVFEVARLTNTTQEMLTHGSVGSALQATARDTPTDTLTGALTVKVTGQSGTASADITLVGAFVEWIP